MAGVATLVLAAASYDVWQISLDAEGPVASKDWKRATWVHGTAQSPGWMSPEDFSVTLENHKVISLPESDWKEIKVGDHFPPTTNEEQQ